MTTRTLITGSAAARTLAIFAGTLAVIAGGATTASAQHPTDRTITSRLEIYDTETHTRTVLKEYPYLIEAPNWTVDGEWLVYNSDGRIFRVAVGDPARDEQIPTGDVVRCNNDHVLSPDGRGLAVSSGSADDGRSRIYVVPLEGGEPRLVTENAPSYLHGWSPDGRQLAYCADRNGNYDVYVIPVGGFLSSGSDVGLDLDLSGSVVFGEEARLTTAEGLDDGPEYSPDGNHIWFNSVRSGLMQVWRMRADGSEQMQITLDKDRNSWFPHVSPDGERVVYIAYRKGDVAPGDHPAGYNVELRLMPAREGGVPETVVELFGGQGSLNVNSWSPCSRYFAFVSYEYGERLEQ